MSVAFGVQNQGAVGTTAAELRKIIQSKWASTGIVAGLAVNGTSGLTYNVAAGMAVCSKGSSDGYTEAWWPGGASPAVAANTASYPRLDAVWITSHDATQGDGDNLVTIGVTQGTAAASPSAPTIPTYATLLALMLVPAGATKTSSASVNSPGTGAIPYGSSLGILLTRVDEGNGTVAQGSETTWAAGNIDLPTRRQIDFKFTITLGSTATGDSSAYVILYVDGARINANEVRAFGSPQTASSQYFEFSAILERGSHSIKAVFNAATGRPLVRKYFQRGNWAGQRLQVVDAGAVA